MKRNFRSKVMTIANSLVKKGYSRSAATVKAWVIVKTERFSVRVAGVSFNQRQQVLAAISGRPLLNSGTKARTSSTATP